MWFDRRRTLVINRKLQLGILFTSLSHVVFVTAVVTLALFAPLVLRLRNPNWDSPETTNAALQILYLHETFWLPALLAVLVVLMNSIRMSHKIAGPIYRFRRVCEAMKAGVVPKPIVLRKGDQLRAEIDEVNAMLDSWRGAVEQVRRDTSALDESLSAYRDLTTSAHSDPKADALWTDIASAEQRLRETIGRLTVED